MSNYVKATNFTTKDTLTSGDPNKIVKGTEIDSEFIAIASAIQSKADLASPAFTGVPTAPTAALLTNTAQVATTAFVQAALQAAYPVGSIYINASVTTNPSVLLGFGTWEAFGAGRVLVGQDTGNALFDTLEETGGSADAIVVSHTHTATSTVTDPGHKHQLSTFFGQGDGGGQTYQAPFSNQDGNVNPSPNINYDTTTNTTSITVATTNASTGSSGTNANLQPYITVKMWKRTA
jgi:hypothetical protein